MEVRTVEAIPLAHSLGEGRSYGSSRGRASERTATLVRLETADGEVGWGEAFAPPRTVATCVEEMLAEDVVGMDPYDVESLAERIYTGHYHYAGPFVICALSGIDQAMWDLRGKATGRPVHRLLGGGECRSVIPYASTMYVTEWDEDPIEPASEAAREGFTAAKIKIGRHLEEDVRRVETIREHLGEEAHVMVDFNGNLRPKDAVQAAKALEPYDLTWIEEPVPPENLSGYRQLRETVDVPIAAGEAHFGRFEFKRLIDERLVDVVQPNIGCIGGFSEARFVAKLATTENVAVRPHVWNSGVGVAAALQFAATAPDYPHSENVREPLLFEFDRAENPLRTEVLETSLDVAGGTLDVPREPGLGVDVDEDAVERFRVD